MRTLGYSLTWVTHCFLDGGCGARVFAHTNGSGDFVIFDTLGSPWPVHECYANRVRSWWLEEAVNSARRAAAFDEIVNRVRAGQTVYEIPVADVDEAANREYERELPEAEPPTQLRDIEQKSAVDYLSEGEFEVVGNVQSLIENAVARQINELREVLGTTGLIEREIARTVGPRTTQITVVNKELKSFTVFADTSRLPLAIRDAVVMRLRAAQPPLPQLSGRHYGLRLLFPFFLCVDIQRLPRLARRPQ